MFKQVLSSKTMLRPLACGLLALTLFSPLARSEQPLLRVVKMPVEFRPTCSRATWDSGYWVQYERSTHPGDRPAVWMYDRDGQNVLPRTEIWFPEAYHIVLRSVAAVGDGSLIASVEVWKAPGDVATALVFVRPPGVLGTVIRTDSFFANAMAVTSQGEIWAFGSSPVRASAPADLLTLRRFAPDGRQIAGYLPWSGFDPPDGMPPKDPASGRKLTAADVRESVTVMGNHGGSHVVTSRSRVGVFSGRTATWVEFDLDGNQIDRFLVNPPAADDPKSTHDITSMAMTADNRVYASFAYHDPKNNGLFELDRTTHKWTRVPKPFTAPGFGGLYGVDGNSLILRSGCCQYGWVDAPDVIGAVQSVAANQ